jgi:hypothetical protein
VVEFVGKWALLWACIAVVFGLLAEALVQLTGRGRRAG